MSVIFFVNASPSGAQDATVVETWVLRGAINPGTPQFMSVLHKPKHSNTALVRLYKLNLNSAPIKFSKADMDKAAAPKPVHVPARVGGNGLDDLMADYPVIANLADMQQRYNVKLSRHKFESRVVIPVTSVRNPYRRGASAKPAWMKQDH